MDGLKKNTLTLEALRMITCDILGYSPSKNTGLGNQLFCIATTLALAIENNDKAVFPELNFHPYTFYGNSIFHKLNKDVFDKKFVKNTYVEESFTSTIYNKIDYKENLCIHGHFQSYKYFDAHEKYIQENITLPDFYLKKIDKKYGFLYEKDTVSLHFRRGDYVNLKGVYCSLG